MHKRTRLLLGALGALIALMALTSTAAARNRVELEPSGPAILLTGVLTFSGGGVSIICLVSLTGSLHRLVAKTVGALAGYITEGRATACRDSSGNREPTTTSQVLATTANPCHIKYGSIRGTLPTITGGTIRVNCRFLIRTDIIFIGATNCLYDDEIEARAAENPFNRVNVEQAGIRVSRTIEGLCPEGTLRGSLGSATRVMVRLLEVR